ncbi:uncharacterized protein LOC111371353 isoform X2 [Olea europaea var. sylvestris]|uniref:uncharacterized protein LOC111371353 isoform X2 n=1 Tax=Olea europaea var. sylvestris TaxID=158386 RepID=UPI000C1CD357|nr:uncharacterized protein LOC111371353 isoform X2 [Olea europaea var. sylvestris]
MSDEGEKTCPLCAEEMDLTDQQLKPCKCGYDICVWCWHHIMDMAEKDETEGRCPACRAPYNKEKIVETGANCERLASEMSLEKKLKSQKGKSKMSEGRKQLSSVRVVQRNLVYVVGLPVNLADEDLLQHKEYFGQYGKVLKVSISRTAAGAIQQFANSTCSVYITYSKEEEAVRCIQSVHGFILEGRSLRACFGTTKYCHAWLRNVPCSNPDCLYLHEIGSQEDSFTKDEIISAYTRVQQITGATNSVQRHSGNVLPAPADDYCISSHFSSGKPSSKTATQTNNSVNSIRVSPPNSSSGRSAALPAGASWGIRSSNNQPLSTSIPCSNGLHKHKPNACNGPVTFSTAVASSSQVSSLHSDSGKKLVPSEESNTSLDKSKLEAIEHVKKDSSTDSRTILSSSSSSVLSVTSTINRQHGQPTSKDKDGDASMLPCTNNSVNQYLKSCGPDSDTDSNDSADGKIENLCSEIFSMSIDRHQQLQNGYAEHIGEPLISQTSGISALPVDEDYASNRLSPLKLETHMQVSQVDSLQMEDNLLSFDKQRLKDPEFASSRNSIPDSSHSTHLSRHSNIHSPTQNNSDASVRVNVDRQIVHTKDNLIVSASSNSVMSNKHPDNEFSSSSDPVNDVEHIYLFPINKDKNSVLGRFKGEAACHSHPAAVDTGESSIISDILSMDSYSWDDSIRSPQNLAKLFGETDERQGPFGVPSSRKIQNSNQSRFSFAREEERMNRASDFGLAINYVEQSLKDRPFGNDFTNSNSFHLEKFGSHNRLSLFNGVESDNFASSHSYISSNKVPVSRSQVSAPPGFSVPSRVPPPGFISHEKTGRIFDPHSGNYMPDASLLPRNQYQASPSGDSISNAEIEFMDPAILAVGKGILPGSLNSSGLGARLSYSPQYSTLEELRFQSLLQRSVPTHQNQRFTDPGDSYSPLGDAYGVPSRVLEQTLTNNLSPFSQFTLPQPRNAVTSNGQWDGWNTVQGENALGMAELLRNERLGLPKYYNGYEDSNTRLPNSGNLYNRANGI